MVDIVQPRIVPRTVAQSSEIEWTVFVDEDEYTWTGVYRDMSFMTVARIYERCYNREFDDWDRDSWNDGQIVAQCDVRPYYLRDLLESRLGSSRESPLQELTASFNNLLGFSIQRLNSALCDDVRACLDCCGVLGTFCTRTRTYWSRPWIWSPWRSACGWSASVASGTTSRTGLCVPGWARGIREVSASHTESRLRGRTTSSSRDGQISANAG